MGWAPYITTTKKLLDPWYAQYRAGLHAKAAETTVVSTERGRIRTLDWKPPPKIRLTACMWCANRPIEAIRSNTVLHKLRLHEMAGAENARMAFRVNEIANLCTPAHVNERARP